jgi:hypothetical protein
MKNKFTRNLNTLFPSSDRLKLLVVSLIILSIGLLTVDRYGINWDEQPGVEMVKNHLEYVLSGEQLGPTTRNHGFIFNAISEVLFTLQDWLNHLLFNKPLSSPLPINQGEQTLDLPSLYARLQFKHVFIFLFSLLAYIGVAGIVTILAGLEFSGLGVIILALFPAFWGHSFFNHKDIPFAAIFTLATFLGACLLDRYIKAEDTPKNTLIADSILYGILVGLVTGTRIAGCFLLFFLIITHLLLIFPRWQAKTLSIWQLYRYPYGLIFLYWALTTLLVYPASWYHSLTPIGWFVQALTSMSKFQPWDNRVLFDGQSIPGRSLPWYYLPKTLSLTTPALFQAIFAGGLLLIAYRFQSLTTRQKACLILVSFQILFIPLLAIVRSSTLYDGMRHFLFMIPPIAAIVATTLAWIYQSLSAKPLKIAAITLLIVLLSPIVIDMIQLHPYQYLYYNRLSGGLAKANGRYETDYWGLSVREGMEWLNHQAPKRSKIVVTGPLVAAQIFADPRKAFQIVHLDEFEEGKEPNPNYYLGLHRSGYPEAFADCSIVHQVQRQGVPLTTIKACQKR